MKRWLSLVLALSLLTAVVPAARAQGCLAEYTVKAGDNLYRIGLAYNIPASVIAAANNLANPSLIFVGQKLCIPAPATAGPSPTPGPSATPTKTPTASAQGCLIEYTVQVGDTLYRIGLAYNIPASVIAAVNNLANPNLIFVGQKLCIPAPATPGPSPTPGPSATPTKTPTPAPTATGGPTAVPTTGPIPGFVIPTFSIVSVVRNTSVTIQTANFPANQTFDVSMGHIGALGVGYAAGSVNSGAGGVFTTTLTIPAALANVSQISVRLQSASGYYSYGWFYNTTNP